MAIRRFEDIKAWQMARDVTRETYRIGATGSFARDYALRDQITRAAGSVMHNIAEGFDAGSNAEFARFLGYANRSCTEVRSELYVALDQGYLDAEKFAHLSQMAGECRAAIRGFLTYLKSGVARAPSKVAMAGSLDSAPDSVNGQ